MSESTVSESRVTLPYLALEGIEGAGKSTVARLLVEALADALGADQDSPLLVREPGGTRAGEQIRQIVLGARSVMSAWTEALLFAAARAQLADEIVRPALAAGTWVVSDRSVYSSLAYQGGGRELGIDAVRAVNQHGLGETWPQLVILLRLDPSVGLDRQAVEDRIGAEGVEFQVRVAAAFDELSAGEPDRFVVLDATRPVDDIVQEAVDEALARWQTAR